GYGPPPSADPARTADEDAAKESTMHTRPHAPTAPTADDPGSHGSPGSSGSPGGASSSGSHGSPDSPDREPTARIAELRTIADRAVDTSRRWLRVAAGLQIADPSADRLAAILGEEGGIDFTVGFVDRVIRTEDPRAAGAALVDIADAAPASLPALDRAQIRAGAALAPIVPQVVVPAARARMRQMLGHMIVDARP